MRRASKRRLITVGTLVLAAVVLMVALNQQGVLQVPGLARAADADADSTATAEVAEKVQEPSVPVEVAAVQRRPLAAFHRAASSIEAARLVEVPCRTAGRVQTTAVEEGDWVEAGQLLAELDNARQKLELRQAELQLAEQERKLERAEKMLAESLISHEEYETQRTASEQAAAARDLAALNLEDTYLRAPFAGQITARQVVSGQQVQASQAAYTLADFDPLRVRVHLPESVAAKIKVGEQVPLETDASSDELQAWVERISPVVDPATGTVQVTLRLPGGADARVGGFVKARLTTDRKRDVLSVPKVALVDEGGLRSVFVAAADTVRKLEITTGLHDATHVEVISGLEEGWTVVTLGRGGLRTGTRVEILPDSSLAALASR
jgi:membrane fusion protein, multidrug efflux system